MNIGFTDLGSLRVITGSDGRIMDVYRDPPVGQYRPGVLGVGRAIQLNAQVNWPDPNLTFALDQNGVRVVLPLLVHKAHELGIASMTAQEFMDLTLLHELSHRFGRDHPAGDAKDLDREIWKACFK